MQTNFDIVAVPIRAKVLSLLIEVFERSIQADVARSGCGTGKNAISCWESRRYWWGRWWRLGKDISWYECLQEVPGERKEMDVRLSRHEMKCLEKMSNKMRLLGKGNK